MTPGQATEDLKDENQPLQSILAPTGPISIARSTWCARVKSGRFPRPVKLGPRTTAWQAEDIRARLIFYTSSDISQIEGGSACVERRQHCA